MASLTVGLTGGIGSGKTLVEKLFTELGVAVLDADQVSRVVVVPPSAALDRIAAEFGAEYLNADGTLNRPLMRSRVFGDERERRRLESILHPLMFQRITEWVGANQGPYCVVSAAILLESGLARLTHRILVVDVPETLQKTRLMARDGISAELADRMLSSQWAREKRLQFADDVVDNSGPIEQTRQRISELDIRYRQMAPVDAARH